MVGKISISVDGIITVADISKTLATVRNSLIEYVGLGRDEKWMTNSLEELN